MTKPESARLISVFSQNEIKQLFKTARTRYQSAEVQIRLAPRSLDYARVLIVVSRKVGNAVTRNLIRRRIKNIFYQDQLYSFPFDWIIIPRAAITTLSFQALKEIINTVIHAQKNTDHSY
jgi:ribonuclease P protein component